MSAVIRPCAPFVPSPDPIVKAMLELAEVGPEDIVIDLGCGDGRVVRTAARDFGARGLGIEAREAPLAKARQEAEREGVASEYDIRVAFLRMDLFKADISHGTVITLYLMPDAVNDLRPKLATLRPGTRICSHDYPLTGWRPIKTRRLAHAEKRRSVGEPWTMIYLYRLPESLP